MALTRTQRLFLALWPDDSVRDQLAAHASQWTWPPVCVRYAPVNWHVTLNFIGNVSADQAADIAASANVPFQPPMSRWRGMPTSRPRQRHLHPWCGE